MKYKVYKKFAWIPTKMTDTNKWIWFKTYYKTVCIKEYDGFEEGIGNITYRIYTTINKHEII